MDQLILQLGGRMADLVKSHSDTLTVGRSFTNDAVISDPYVDPEQITFFRSENGWSVRMIQGTNPALLNGKPICEGNSRVESGDQISIGRTLLRIYSSEHIVEPTHKTLLSYWFHHGRSHLLFALSMLVITCALTLLERYQASNTELNWNEMLLISLWVGLIILFWASAWSLTGRLLRHQPNFTAQLGFTALFTCCTSILTPIESYAGYAANSELLGEIIQWLTWLLTLTLLLRVNLSFATNLKHPATIGFITASAMLLTSYTMIELAQEEFSTQPTFAAVLKPPFAYLSDGNSAEEFLNVFDENFEFVNSLIKDD